jgi:tetratricopeptide (TPR) repeat protein/DNA-binding winged helix-turn-helix (wHTH) protein
VAAMPVTGYYFGEWKLDVSRGCLICGNRELVLRYQSLQLLIVFLEHPGVLLSKDDLTSVIWPGTSVTDNALAQCITEIRRGLKDDSRNPRYIKTFPKIGYRFIAEVEVTRDLPQPVALERLPYQPPPDPQPETVAIALAGAAALQETCVPVEPDQTVHTLLTTRLRLVPMAVFSLLLLFLCGDMRHTAGQLHTTPLPASGIPTLAVFSLANGTGRPDLDWLREGLSDMILTDLSHTGRWNVLSREEIHGLSDGNSSRELQIDKALELARSVHAKGFVMGTVAGSGQQIEIRIETRDGIDGHLIATDSTSLIDPREIVAGASLLSTDIARHFGVALDDSPALGEVMTNNVEAYRYYSVGVEKAEQFQNAQAIELLKKAIQLDPHFAMAYARIGYAYAVQDFQGDNGRPYLERALHLSASLPAINRLYIEAWLAIADSNYDAAINTLQEITNQYPNETEAYCQLSRLLRGQEKVTEAAALLRGAIERQPNAKDLYNAYGFILLSMERPLDAVDAYRQYVMLAPQNPNGHDSLGMSYQQTGQYEAAVSEYNQALRLDPEFEPSIVHLGDAYYQEGRYKDALNEYQRYVQVTKCSDAKALGYGNLANVYLAMDKLQEAQMASTEELRYNHRALWNSLVLALTAHQEEQAKALEQRLTADIPNSERGSQHDIRMKFFYRGYFELKTGDTQDAINHFKAALQHLPPSSGIDLHEDCLANAYLELDRVTDAIAEYKRILKINPHYPLAYFHLGLAYQRLNDSQNAFAAFQHFLEENTSADQDNPIILKAKQDLGLMS